MRFNKNQAYLLVLGIVILYVIIDKTYFLLRSGFIKGVVVEQHIRTSSFGGYSTYTIVQFTTDHYIVKFTGEDDLDLKIGDIVDVVYLKSELTNAKVYSFAGLWLNDLIAGIISFILISGIVYNYIDSKDIIIIGFDNFFTIKRLTKERDLNKHK